MEDKEPEEFDFESIDPNWHIVRQEHLDLFILWRNMSGMGGESLESLWRLSREPGSAVLLRDFRVLSTRLRRIEAIKKWREKHAR